MTYAKKIQGKGQPLKGGVRVAAPASRGSQEEGHQKGEPATSSRQKEKEKEKEKEKAKKPTAGRAVRAQEKRTAGRAAQHRAELRAVQATTRRTIAVKTAEQEARSDMEAAHQPGRSPGAGQRSVQRASPGDKGAGVTADVAARRRSL